METYYISLILMPIVTMLIGYFIGRRHGWKRRDDEEKLNKIKEEIEGLINKDKSKTVYGWWVSSTTMNTPKDIDPELYDPPLEEQLKNAITNENYELAQKIQDQINQQNKDK